MGRTGVRRGSASGVHHSPWAWSRGEMTRVPVSVAGVGWLPKSHAHRLRGDRQAEEETREWALRRYRSMF
jgi:hypothetical protein